MKNRYKIQKAFTLAEVLITLLIIGVVASLVVPALINDTQDAELKTAWRKAYSELDQATRRIIQDNAGSLIGICATGNDSCLKNLYLPYLNYTKSCGPNNGCWHEVYKFKHLDGTPVNWGDETYNGVILTNGAIIDFNEMRSDCSYSKGSITVCGQINIDVNGLKTPNVVGKDIFRIHLLYNSILPAGSTGDTYSPLNECNNSSPNCWGCSSKYLYQ
jgi:prepilin-type N-terminal cleavage/methylation domain-containing protein